MEQKFQFLKPEFFWLFLPLTLLLVFYIFWRRRILKKNSRMFLDQSFVFDSKKNADNFGFLSWVLAFSFLIISLTQPVWGHQTLKVTKKVHDVFFVVDVSRSMLVSDVKPNRLKAALYRLRYVAQAKKGQRFGLVVFAGRATKFMPLTTDRATFENFLKFIEVDIVPVSGSNFLAALQVAKKSFHDSLGSNHIVVLSDTEKTSTQQTNQMELIKQKLIQDKIKVHALVLGTASGGPIPGPDGSFLKDNKQNLILSKSNPSYLANLVSQTGGILTEAQSGFKGIDKIFSDGIESSNAQKKIDNSEKIVPNHVFQWFLGGALIFMGLYLWQNRRLKKLSALTDSPLKN